jgi:hypothetical protein|tara:strand:+ start:37 stop:462 length:426 start_codon:yes stop_codon:yes gene_type:complete
MITFNADLKQGQAVEDLILGLIRFRYPQAERFIGKCKPYDIYVPERNIYIEVKADKKSIETGNIVVEIEMFGKPSGLNSTKSDFWVFCTPAEYLWIRPARIWECISRNMLKPVKFVGTGDTQEKIAYLVPVQQLREYSELP